MKESSVIQGFLDEGAKKVLLGIGEDLFGPADDSIRTQIESLRDSDQIAQLARRAHHVNSWVELLTEARNNQSLP